MIGSGRARPSRSALLRGFGSVAAVAATGVRSVASAADDALPLIALVHTQAAGDDGITDDMIASFRRVATEQKMRARVIYASDPTNYEPILELLGEYGARIVLGTFDEMGQPMSSVAPNFPATRFVQIYGDPLPKPLPNMRTVAYDTYLGAYLVGVCAAHISRTGKIGYVGGASIPPIDADANAMRAGLRSVHPGRSLVTTFVGSFQDPAKAFQIAEQMYRSGIDFIQVEGAGSDLGVIKSATAKPDRMVSGAASNEDRWAPTALATIFLCDFAKSIREQVLAALRPVWTAGHINSGLADGTIRYFPSEIYLHRAPKPAVAALRAAWPHVELAKAKIVAGTLSVPFNTNV